MAELRRGGARALAAGYSYVRLAADYGEGGGAFTFLREIHAEGFAGSLSWVLIVGYVLTNAVYAFTFGQYLGHVVGGGAWVARAAAVAIVALFVGLNLRGTGEAGGVEVVLVWFKLAVLVGLAAFGLWRWDVPALSEGVASGGIGAALFGAASVFMAYEGFQLLTYDYDDIRDPDTTLPRVVLSSIVVVIGVYVIVALGVTMLVGASGVVGQEEVALAVAGGGVRDGRPRRRHHRGGVLDGLGHQLDALRHGAAREGGRAGRRASRGGGAREQRGRAGPRGHHPGWAGGGAGRARHALGARGGGEPRVPVHLRHVCALAFREKAGSRFITGAGALAASGATVALVVRLVRVDPWALGALAVSSSSLSSCAR